LPVWSLEYGFSMSMSILVLSVQLLRRDAWFDGAFCCIDMLSALGDVRVLHSWTCSESRKYKAIITALSVAQTSRERHEQAATTCCCEPVIIRRLLETRQ
jgi:hypothetical protein